MNFSNLTFVPIADKGLFCDIPSKCVLGGIQVIESIHNYYALAFYISLVVYIFVDAFGPLIPRINELITKYARETQFVKSISMFIIVVWCLLLIVYR